MRQDFAEGYEDYRDELDESEEGERRQAPYETIGSLFNGKFGEPEAKKTRKAKASEPPRKGARGKDHVPPGRAKSRRAQDLELLENASRKDIEDFDKKLFSRHPPWFRILTDLHWLMPKSDDILLFSYALNVSGMHAGGEPNKVKARRQKAEETGYEYRKKPRWKGAWFRFTVDRVQAATGFNKAKQVRILNRLEKKSWLWYKRKGPGGLRYVLINYRKLSRRLKNLQQARWEG